MSVIFILNQSSNTTFNIYLGLCSFNWDARASQMYNQYNRTMYTWNNSSWYISTAIYEDIVLVCNIFNDLSF